MQYRDWRRVGNHEKLRQGNSDDKTNEIEIAYSRRGGQYAVIVLSVASSERCQACGHTGSNLINYFQHVQSLVEHYWASKMIAVGGSAVVAEKVTARISGRVTKHGSNVTLAHPVVRSAGGERCDSIYDAEMLVYQLRCLDWLPGEKRCGWISQPAADSTHQERLFIVHPGICFDTC